MKRFYTYFKRNKRFSIIINIRPYGSFVRVRGFMGKLQKIFLFKIFNVLKNNGIISFYIQDLDLYHSYWPLLFQLVSSVTRGWQLKFALYGIIFACDTPEYSLRTKRFRKFFFGQVRSAGLREVGKRKLEEYKKYVYLKLGCRHLISVRLPNDSFLWTKKRDIRIVTINKQDLRNFAIRVRSLYWPNIYKGTGLQYRGEIVNLKPGKIR